MTTREWDLFRWLAEQDRVVDRARLERVVEAVLAEYAGDRGKYSNVLEPSVAAGREGVSLTRFSYAFPRHRTDPSRVARQLLTIAEALGDGVAASAERIVRAARHRIVEQPLIGLAVDGGGTSFRPKLYLQLVSGAPDVARRLAAAVLSMDPSALPTRDLHLVGLDLDGDGQLVGAKLYERVSASAGERWLRGLPPASLADVLLIRRLHGPTAVPDFTEVDFAVGGGSIVWEGLRASIPELAAVEALAAAFPIRVRRASLAPDGRATAYYVLA